MTNPTLITTPFAENGDKNTIPESVGANPQNATMQAGFPPITQQKISEGGIPPERNDFNGILNLYGQHIVHLNKGLPYEFDQAFADAIGGYPLNARIMLDNGDIVKNTIPSNTNNPNSDMTGWVEVNSASQIFDENGKSQQEINDLFYKNLSASAFVDAYGADPTGVNSSVTGIREAMKATIKNISGWQLVNGGVTGHVVFGPGIYKIDINNLLVFAESYKRSYVFSGAGRQNTILLVQHDGSADTWYLADSKVSQNIYATLFENLTIICSNKDKFVIRRFAGDGGSDKQCWFSNCNLGTVNGASGRFIIENNYGMTGVIDCDKDLREYNSDLTRMHMCLVNVEQYVLKLQNTQSVDHRITSSYLMTNQDIIQSIAGGSVSISDSGIALKGGVGGHVFHFLNGNYVATGNKLYSATNIQMECVDSGLVKTESATNAKCLFYGLNISTGVSTKINKIRVTNRGSGYTTAPTVAISGTGTGATATASISTGITGATVTAGGTDYTYPPIVKISGDGTGAELQAIVSGGSVTGFNVINAGRGYTTATLTLIGGKNQDAPVGTTQATATAVLSGVVDEITVTNSGSGYHYTTSATVTLSGGGGTGATAIDVRSLPNFVDIHAPTQVFIENCGEGISQTEFGYTVRTEHQTTNQAVGIIEMKGFNPTSILNLKKDKNRPVFENTKVTGDKTPSYIAVDGVFQAGTTDSTDGVSTHAPSAFIVGNGRGSNVTKNRNSQFFQIKGIGEYWPDTTTTNQNTLMQRFWLPKGTILKGLLLNRPSQSYSGLPYKVYLVDAQGNIYAESDWLSKSTGWSTYISVNKVLTYDTQFLLKGSAQGFRVALDQDGQALLEIA